MRSAGNFHPEWGYLAPAPSFMRTVRIALVATAIGATAGAVVVVSLVERPGANDDNTSIAAHALVTSTPVETSSVTTSLPVKAATLAQSPMPADTRPTPSSAAPALQAGEPKTIPSASQTTPETALTTNPDKPETAPPLAPASMAALSEPPPTAEEVPAPIRPDVVVPEAAPAKPAAIKKRRAEGYRAKRRWQAANAKRRWRNNRGFGPLFHLFSFRTGSSRSTN